MVFAKAKIRFSTEMDAAIDEYVTALDTYIANTAPIPGWKYEVIPTQPAPPDVPADIHAELTKFGFDTNGRINILSIPSSNIVFRMLKQPKLQNLPQKLVKLQMLKHLQITIVLLQFVG